MDMEHARFNMIEQQIRPWNVLDAHVLQLLEVVKREDFVPLAHKALAFVDMEIPLREGGARGQVMLAPRVEARLLQDANVQKHEKVLEVGAGSGYMAALLAHRAQRVVSVEIEPELARMARANLQKAGIHNVEVLELDAAKGVKGDGPFDVIVLSGSVAEVPQVLLAQLKVGGRLIGIVGDEPAMYCHPHDPHRRGHLDNHDALGHRGAATAELRRAVALQVLSGQERNAR
jgi:protein-L-isoaspartate(D-aspartate) O-methyltransferase